MARAAGADHMTDVELHALAERYAAWSKLGLPSRDDTIDLAKWGLRLEQERDELKQQNTHLLSDDGPASYWEERAKKAEATLMHQDGLLNSAGRQAVDRAVKAEAELASARFCEAHQPPHASCPCCEAVHADDELAAIRRLCLDAGMVELNTPLMYLPGVFYMLKRKLKELATLRDGLQKLSQWIPVGTTGWVRWCDIAALLETK